MVILKSRENYSFPNFKLLTTILKQTFVKNTNLNAIIYKNLNLPIFCLPASQPAVRPGCAKCMDPEFLHSKGNYVRFTKLLFWRMLIYCAMVLIFIFMKPFKQPKQWCNSLCHCAMHELSCTNGNGNVPYHKCIYPIHLWDVPYVYTHIGCPYAWDGLLSSIIIR